MQRPVLKLYVAGQSPNSARAVKNLQTICHTQLGGAATIEVIDVLKEPERALADNVVVTPTLVKTAPAPRQVIVGSLSKTDEVLSALGLASLPGQESGGSSKS